MVAAAAPLATSGMAAIAARWAHPSGPSPPSTVSAVKDFGFDPQRALDTVKRLAADAPAQFAGGLGRLVGDATPERLEQVMRSPARKPILDGIFWQLPKQRRPGHLPARDRGRAVLGHPRPRSPRSPAHRHH
jgi:hypothetical protein